MMLHSFLSTLPTLMDLSLIVRSLVVPLDTGTTTTTFWILNTMDGHGMAFHNDQDYQGGYLNLISIVVTWVCFALSPAKKNQDPAVTTSGPGSLAQICKQQLLRGPISTNVLELT